MVVHLGLKSEIKQIILQNNLRMRARIKWNLIEFKFSLKRFAYSVILAIYRGTDSASRAANQTAAFAIVIFPRLPMRIVMFAFWYILVSEFCIKFCTWKMSQSQGQRNSSQTMRITFSKSIHCYLWDIEYSSQPIRPICMST